ncbi:hypothetical protein LIER_17117 [Lithospermum erythrorhizon]|uniref:Uncharacterized protein n=1 Tax=Lithospermum erythrorhizon TaxID=34254 RepID=A0AAV3QAJ4_LITER
MANESFSLGEPMSNEKLVRKVMRTLPRKYAHKVENEILRKLRVDQDQEIQHLKAQVNALNKGLKMMNSSTNILEEILSVGKNVGGNTGICSERLDLAVKDSASNGWSSTKVK